jgi:poly(A) polymerase
MARKRLTELRFPKEVIADVSKLVELHLRFHGYGDGEWTDSAVRRYVADAGPLLTRLHALTRADSTTRNARKAARLAATYDALEARIEVLREQEELDKIRPELDGGEIMQILGLTPGPLVGQAWNHLLELRMSDGVVGKERATEELLAWAARAGIAPPPGPPTA